MAVGVSPGIRCTGYRGWLFNDLCSGCLLVDEGKFGCIDLRREFVNHLLRTDGRQRAVGVHHRQGFINNLRTITITSALVLDLTPGELSYLRVGLRLHHRQGFINNLRTITITSALVLDLTPGELSYLRVGLRLHHRQGFINNLRTSALAPGELSYLRGGLHRRQGFINNLRTSALAPGELSYLRGGHDRPTNRLI